MARHRLLPAGCFILGLALSGAAGADGLPKTDPNYQRVLKLDQDLFGASNRCDIAAFAAMIDEGLEFYHDKTGLSVGKASLVEATEKNLCHKVRRELRAETLEVFPLANYGFIELGQHTFCNLKETATCTPETSGDGRFFMLWRQVGETYKLARVISYDHVSSWERQPKGATPR